MPELYTNARAQTLLTFAFKSYNINPNLKILKYTNRPSMSTIRVNWCRFYDPRSKRIGAIAVLSLWDRSSNILDFGWLWACRQMVSLH